MIPLTTLVLTLLAPAPQDPSGPVPAGMLRYPDVSESHIVFSYANDLWLVSRDGGTALPLASPDGGERFPRFSPDGSEVAFVGNYDGDTDLYPIPTGGGFAHRVTHHPSNETLCDWLPDGELLYFSDGLAGLGRQDQVFTVDVAGGMPTTLPVPYGTFSSVDETGTWLAYTPRTRDNRTWKRYRGGLASDIWLFNLKDMSAKRATTWEGTDTQPMWWGDQLYFLSDAGEEHRLNLWRLDPDGGDPEQLTFYADDDIRWPSMGPGSRGRGEIVYQLGSKLMLFDLASGRDRSVEVFVPGERSNLRPRMVDAADYISSWDISPSAKRAVVEARGDIWTLPAENGQPRNLTASNGTAERSPAWSPDGRWVSYFSDASGEYELWITQSDGKGKTRQLTDGGGVFKLGMDWAPDSKSIAFIDSEGTLRLHDVEAGATTVVDESPFGFWVGSIGGFDWSRDSRWLAYSRASEDNLQNSIWVYDTEEGARHRLTSGFFGDASPAFSRDGKFLYYTSSRRFSPTYSSLDTTFVYEDSQVLIAVPLQADAERMWVPESDEETWDEEETESSPESEEAEEPEGEEQEVGDEAADAGIDGTWSGTLTADVMPDAFSITIEVTQAADGSLSGTVTTDMGTATIEGGSYDAATGAMTMTLLTDEGETIEITGSVSGNSMTGSGTVVEEGMQITITFEVERAGSGSGGGQDGDDDAEEEEVEPVVIDFEGFEARGMQLPVRSGNFGNLLVNASNQLMYSRFGEGGGIKLLDISDDPPAEKSVTGGGAFLLSADGKKMLVLRGRNAALMDAKAGASGGNVPTKGMDLHLDPKVEWPQLYTDAWRIFRDYFYDPNMHGVDWQEVHDHYASMIPYCASREDLTFLIGEMIAEANVGHAYLSGNGDGSARGPSVNVGMLGVDFAVADGAYRIERIYRGADWDTDAIGPLSRQGVDVAEGDYLLAVNGQPMDMAKDPWAAFVGLGNREVALTVSAKPTMDDEAREVVVKTLTSESVLRYRAWIEANRRYVEEKSGGRLGYIYVPDTGINGQNDLFRQFYGQILKDGLIIDERWNGGGQIPTRFIELLNRPATNYWATRGTRDMHWPPDSHQGPKCMLINEDAGSGGDAFPSYFRQAGLGKLIGRRTWGGLVGISGNPGLIDGGGITVPTFAFYDNDGTWGVEGHGVDPDIEVMDDPALMWDGGDPQLDAALEHMLELIASEPYVKPTRPAYPDRSGLGIAPEDK
ncbi:MAG: S41 family peptidase [Planctomycetota bacterium]|jgi:tricorn protease